MIVWVDDQLFQGETARDVDRLALLRGAAVRRHTLIVSTDPADTHAGRTSPAFDRWRDALPEGLQREVDMLRERLDLVSGNATTRGAERILVSERAPWTCTAACWLTLEEAVRAVVLPTCVLVENAINDRAFLRRVMPPEWRQRLDGWERTGLLRYENGGGNSVMSQLIRRHAEEAYARQAFGLPSRLWRLVHVIVHDHDGRDADHPSGDALKVEQACQAAGLAERSHRLCRRAQEYYLPREALEAIVDGWVNSAGDRVNQKADIDAHMVSGEGRHFAALPGKPLFKNKFIEDLGWQDAWFQADGAWPEMTLLAEKIAAAI